jgi:hypothetical protein
LYLSEYEMRIFSSFIIWKVVVGSHLIITCKVKNTFPTNDLLITQCFGGWSSYIMGCLIFG